MLVDPENYDFRPIQGSSLIDAGIIVQNISENYNGSAPDLGAYEYNGDYWVPGISWDLESTFGTSFIEVQGLNNDQRLINIPQCFKLYPAYPNPFNPSTTFRYDLIQKAHVNITIYDMLGREIKTIFNQIEDPGNHSLVWNGLNNHGETVSGGIYVYVIQAGQSSTANKVIFLK